MNRSKGLFSPINDVDLVDRLLKVSGDQSLFVGVSDSTLDPMLREVRRRKQQGQCGLIQTNHEEIAAGISAGHFLGSGLISFPYLQNSGICYAGEPIISLHATFEIPGLFIVGWRGWDPKEETSEPHLKVGEFTPGLVKALPIKKFGPSTLKYAKSKQFVWNVRSSLDDAIAYVTEEQKPAVFLMPEGSIAETKKDNPFPESFVQPDQNFYDLDQIANTLELMQDYPAVKRMKRQQAVLSVMDRYQSDPDVLFVVCNGFLSRDVRAWADDARNFYSTGFYGGALSIGMGLAIAQPNKKVVVLDGNDNAVAGTNNLPVREMLRQHNLDYYILDNGLALSTGGHSSAPLTLQHFLHAKEVIKISDEGYKVSGRVPANKAEMDRFKSRAQAPSRSHALFDRHAATSNVYASEVRAEFQSTSKSGEEVPDTQR